VSIREYMKCIEMFNKIKDVKCIFNECITSSSEVVILGYVYGYCHK